MRKSILDPDKEPKPVVEEPVFILDHSELISEAVVSETKFRFAVQPIEDLSLDNVDEYN